MPAMLNEKCASVPVPSTGGPVFVPAIDVTTPALVILRMRPLYWSVTYMTLPAGSAVNP